MRQCTYQHRGFILPHTCLSAWNVVAIAVRAVQGRLPRAINDRDQVALAQIRADMVRLRPPYLRLLRGPCTPDGRACTQIP